MAVAAAVSLYLQIALGWDSDQPRDFAHIMLMTVSVTTIAWLAVTWLTAPEPQATLVAFYERVRPYPGGWRPIARETSVAAPATSIGRELLNALLGCVLVYAALFGVGAMLLRSVASGFALLAIAALAATSIARNLDADDLFTAKIAENPEEP